MDIKSILLLMDRMNQIGLSRVEVTEKDFSLKLEKGNINEFAQAPQAIISPAPAPAPAAAAPTQPAYAPASAPEAPSPKRERQSGHEIRSPIVGTFYAASSPDAPPFVTVGQKVKKGDVVCIIEAMKMFNEIQSDYDGVVKEICVKNGDPLEFGQCIMIIG